MGVDKVGELLWQPRLTGLKKMENVDNFDKVEVDKALCQYLSLGVDKGEGSALATKVNERRGGLQVLRQAQSGGAGGQQGERKEVHLCNCLWLALIGLGVDGVK